MIELAREFAVVAFATSAELNPNNLSNDPAAELNDHVTPENSLLVIRPEGDQAYRLYCGGELVEGFEMEGKAGYAVHGCLNGEPVAIGNSAGGAIKVGGTEFRTPTVFFTGDRVATVSITKAAGQPDKLGDLTF